MNGVITGVGEVTPSKAAGRGVSDVVLDAIRQALADAGITAADVGGIITESSIMPSLVSSHDVAAVLGMKNVRVNMQSTPVGTGILQAVGIAQSLVDAGTADHVLTYFGVDWATRREGPSEYNAHMSAKGTIETPSGFAGPPLYMAMMARAYAQRHGLSDDRLERLLFEVVQAARANALLHPDAQFRRAIDYDGYRASPMIASPLRKADCCLLSDGAVAFVISNRKKARVAPEAMVEIAGWSWADGPWEDASFFTQSDMPDLPTATTAMKQALDRAGMAIADIDVRELYDCFSITPIVQLEALGFCAPGRASEYVADGALRTTGAHPTNTHGGLLSHAYLLIASHLSEAVYQLRHVAGARQVPQAATAMVGAGASWQYCALLLRRADDR